MQFSWCVQGFQPMPNLTKYCLQQMTASAVNHLLGISKEFCIHFVVGSILLFVLQDQVYPLWQPLPVTDLPDLKFNIIEIKIFIKEYKKANHLLGISKEFCIHFVVGSILLFVLQDQVYPLWQPLPVTDLPDLKFNIIEIKIFIKEYKKANHLLGISKEFWIHFVVGSIWLFAL